MSKWMASLLLGIALLAGATGLAWAQRSAAHIPTSQLPPMLVRPAQPLGVNVALEQYNTQQRAETLDAIAAAGFGWVRQRFPWDQIETAPAVYEWALWDEIVADAAAHGLELVAVLDGSPAWARLPEDAANPLAPPASRADFGRFVAAFAGRYGPSLRLYQVWDEPNIAPHWGDRYVDAADYAGLLREAAVQLRSADPDALILLAALAPNVEPGGLNQSDLAYLDALYAAGAAPWFDAVAAQPYGFDRPPDDPPAADVLNFRRAELLRQVMMDRGDGETPIWLTAFGWHSATGDGDTPWRSVPPDVQATWAVDAFGLAWTAWQPAQPAGDPRWGFALVTPEGEASPTLDALSSWAQTLHPLGPGTWPLTTPAVQAEGGWRLLSQAADPPHGAALGNNHLRIPFEGATLALDVQRGPYWGYLDVAVDGQPANALPRDAAGRTNLLLHDPLGQQATVVVARDLPAGPHVAEISAAGGWEQWPLLAVRVSNSAPPRWPGWLVWALGVSGIALVGAGVAGIRRQPAAERTTGDASPSIFDDAERVPAAARYILLAGLAVAVALGPPLLQPVALGLLFALFVVWPATGLALAAVTAPLFLVLVPILGRPLSPAEATIWLLAAALATRALIEFALCRYVKKGAAPGWIVPGRLQALDWAVLTLLAVAVASLVAADNLGVALRELRTVIVAGVLAYWLVRLAPANRDGLFDPWPVVWGIGAGAAAVAGWGVYQAMGGVGLIGAEGVWRVRGPYGSPNNLALYLDHALPIVLAVAVFGVQRGRRLAAGMLAGWALALGGAGPGGTGRAGAAAAVRHRALRRPVRFAGWHQLLPGTALARGLEHGAGASLAGRGAGQLPLRLPHPLCPAHGLAGVEPESSPQHRVGFLDPAGLSGSCGGHLAVRRGLPAGLAGPQARPRRPLGAAVGPAGLAGCYPGPRPDRQLAVPGRSDAAVYVEHRIDWTIGTGAKRHLEKPKGDLPCAFSSPAAPASSALICATGCWRMAIRSSRWTI